MRANLRPYDHAADFEQVGQFLVRTYRSSGGHINWVQPRWEYMHYHPLIRGVDLRTIGIWEAPRGIVGLVHPEHEMGTAYFEIDPDHGDLKRAMLTHAEQHLSVWHDGMRRLRIYLNEQDDDFQAIAATMGYEPTDERDPMSRFVIPTPFPRILLPRGYRLRSLAEDNDLRKVDRVLWRGFGHGDSPPEDGIADREFMQSAPNFRKDLTVVVEAPDGAFVSFCGMWYEPIHAIAYVEPVATDPDYRAMGLGRAAVLEGIRRCGALGASEAWVGSTMPFYLSFGFRPAYQSRVWRRAWTRGGEPGARGSPAEARGDEPGRRGDEGEARSSA